MPPSLAASREAIVAFAAALLFLLGKEVLGMHGATIAYGMFAISFVVILVREVPRRILRLAVVFAVAGVVFFNGTDPSWSASGLVGMAAMMTTKKVEPTQ